LDIIKHEKYAIRINFEEDDVPNWSEIWEISLVHFLWC